MTIYITVQSDKAREGKSSIIALLAEALQFVGLKYEIVDTEGAVQTLVKDEEQLKANLATLVSNGVDVKLIEEYASIDGGKKPAAPDAGGEDDINLLQMRAGQRQNTLIREHLSKFNSLMFICQPDDNVKELAKLLQKRTGLKYDAVMSLEAWMDMVEQNTPFQPASVLITVQRPYKKFDPRLVDIKRPGSNKSIFGPPRYEFSGLSSAAYFIPNRVYTYTNGQFTVLRDPRGSTRTHTAQGEFNLIELVLNRPESEASVNEETKIEGMEGTPAG